MNKLLKLLGQEAYDSLKLSMGDAFNAFEQQFENDEITKDDVIAKQTEFNLIETKVDDPVVTDPVVNEPTVEEPVVNAVLADGWLKDTGDVDYDKIGDETLRNYIKALNERLKQSEWDYKYKMAVMIEALQANMYDTSDADKYINFSDLSIDDDGNVIGIKEAFEKLRENKPHLFKKDEGNGVSGFNPAKSKKTDGYVNGMSFADAWN